MRISGPVEDIWRAVLGREVRISGPGEDIWVAVLGQEVRISGPGEDIWMAVLRREVRISGSGEDIWMAVLEREGDGERRGRDQGAAPAYMLAPWLLEFGRSREHRLEAQNIFKNARQNYRFLWK